MHPLSDQERRAIHERCVARHLARHADDFTCTEWQITGLKFIVATAVFGLGYKVLEWYENKGEGKK